MLRKIGSLLLVLLPSLALADPNDGGLSDECLRSVRDLYKFYYYEIQPSPKSENFKNNQPLGSMESLQMQIVISDLKKHCSPEVIARVNDNLQSDNSVIPSHTSNS